MLWSKILKNCVNIEIVVVQVEVEEVEVVVEVEVVGKGTFVPTRCAFPLEF